MKNFIKKAGTASKNLKVNDTHIQDLANNFIVSPDENKNNGKYTITKKDVLKNNNSILKRKTNSKTSTLEDMIMGVANNISSCGVLRYLSTDETHDLKNKTLTWTIKFKAVGITNGSEDMTTLKEVLRNLIGKTSTATRNFR